MKIFKEPNTKGNWLCPICKTNEVKEVTLIEIEETTVDGTRKAEQFHIDCIDLVYFKDNRIEGNKYINMTHRSAWLSTIQ